MDLLSPATQYTAGTIVLLTVAFLLFKPTGLVQWLQKKNYQYEVTFALYMLTPTERFVFSTPTTLHFWLHCANNAPDSVLFLTLSMLAIATVLYLPNHIMEITRRGYYYFAGEAAASDISGHAAGMLSETASKASEVMSGLAETAYQATMNTVVAVQETVAQAAGTSG